MSGSARGRKAAAWRAEMTRKQMLKWLEIENIPQEEWDEYLNVGLEGVHYEKSDI